MLSLLSATPTAVHAIFLVVLTRKAMYVGILVMCGARHI